MDNMIFSFGTVIGNIAPILSLIAGVFTGFVLIKFAIYLFRYLSGYEENYYLKLKVDILEE